MLSPVRKNPSECVYELSKQSAQFVIPRSDVFDRDLFVLLYFFLLFSTAVLLQIVFDRATP
jgi:hypothetical protein